MCYAMQSSVGMGMGVCMCVSSAKKYPVDSYLCVCVCNRSAPGSTIKEAYRDMCVFVHTKI